MRGASAKSAQIGPFVRKRRNWTNTAPNATRRPKRIRPARESGVVFGSEIMKKAKSRSAPLWSRWSGIASGSPSHAERAEEKAGVPAEKGEGDVGARRALDDEAAEAGDEEPEERRRCPTGRARPRRVASRG